MIFSLTHPSHVAGNADLEPLRSICMREEKGSDIPSFVRS